MLDRPVEELMESLLETVKNKSVYHTLEKILKSEDPDFFRTLIGLSSLNTHILIEMEHGNMEYLPLLLEVNGKVQRLLEELKS